MLSELNINAEGTPNQTLAFNDFDGQFVLPELHTVRFLYTQGDWKCPVVHGLRELHLQDWDPGSLKEMMSFLHALNACQALEVLDIDYAFPFHTYSLDTGERDVSGPVISLPNIEALTICCEPTEDYNPDLYYLLSHLSLS